MKHAVLASLVNVNVSAAKVHFAKWQTFVSLHKTGHHILHLSAIKTIWPP